MITETDLKHTINHINPELEPVLDIETRSGQIRLRMWIPGQQRYSGSGFDITDEQGQPRRIRTKKTLYALARSCGFKPSHVVVNGMAPDDSHAL